MSFAEIKDWLHRSGHKVTPQRVTIIKVVVGSNEHLTPTAIYKKVHRIDPDIGEVTVYRTLNILEKMGVVCLLHTGDNTHSYIVSPTEHHDHIICSDCGRVVNFLHCNLAELEERLSTETGFAIKEHHLDFYGKCQECAVSNKKA